MGYHVKEVALRSVTEALIVKGGRLGKPALHNHAVPFAGETMTNRAVDIKTLSPSVQFLPGDLSGKTPNELSIHFTPKEKIIIVSCSLRDRVRYQGAR
jgi:hypothetical protein